MLAGSVTPRRIATVAGSQGDCSQSDVDTFPRQSLIVVAEPVTACTKDGNQSGKCAPGPPLRIKRNGESLELHFRATLSQINNHRRTKSGPQKLNPVSASIAFEVLPVSLRAVSRSLELSLQSSLQLSLTVLVSYRTRGRISLVLDGVYHRLRAALSSNPTLGEKMVPVEEPARSSNQTGRTGLSSSSDVSPNQRDSSPFGTGNYIFPLTLHRSETFF
jgi:hypothetical protein